MSERASSIESLEARVAPASLLNPRTILYTDVDGDAVKIVFSKNVFLGATDAARLALANSVLTFDLGTVAHDTSGTQQLRLIDFTKFPTSASLGSSVNGVGVTITAVLQSGGDGRADVGAIKAVGVSLGKVVIDGDLGQIDAGGSGLKIGLAGLTVDSIGKRGTATQIPVPNPTADNPAPDLSSTITGELTKLTVAHDVDSAILRVVDGKNSSNQVTTAAKIGSLTIGGSLLGRTAVETASDDTGEIKCDRDIGPVVIGTTASNGIIGGGGMNAGSLAAGGKIASIRISGGVFGGAGTSSGTISTKNSVGAISLGADLAGGAGDGSGVIRIYGNVTSLTVGDDVVAGAGPGSGLFSAFGAVNTVLVKGDLDGTTANAGPGSAVLFANGLTKVTVNGSLLGGVAGTATIESGTDLGTVTILGSVTGGAGNGSANVIADGQAKSIVIQGSLAGGAGVQSGAVRSGTDVTRVATIGSVSIGGTVTGGDGNDSGSILGGGDVKSLTIGSARTPMAAALTGGAGEFSGAMTVRGTLGRATIFGHVEGGSGAFSGALVSTERTDANGEFAGNAGVVRITGHLAGGAGPHSGSIRADGSIAQLLIGGVLGGTGAASGSIGTGAGLFGSADLGVLRVAGDFQQSPTTPGAGSATVVAGGNIKSLTVTGNTAGATIRAGLAGGTFTFTGDFSDSVLSALGQAKPGPTTDLALARLSIGGSVSNSSILAGYDASGVAASPDAQIGSVTVKGDWSASNLVAGAVEGADAGFGNPLDAKAPGDDLAGIFSKIAAVTIRGTVSASATPGENFGFVAQLVGRMKVGNTVLALNTMADGQVLAVAPGVNVVEIGV